MAATSVVANAADDYGGFPDEYTYLGNPNACFEPDARLYFHAASLDYLAGIVFTREPTADAWSATRSLVLPYCSPAIKRWIKSKGGLKVTTFDMLELKGRELHRMARICPPVTPQDFAEDRKKAIQQQAISELPIMNSKQALEAMEGRPASPVRLGP